MLELQRTSPERQPASGIGQGTIMVTVSQPRYGLLDIPNGDRLEPEIDAQGLVHAPTLLGIGFEGEWERPPWESGKSQVLP